MEAYRGLNSISVKCAEYFCSQPHIIFVALLFSWAWGPKQLQFYALGVLKSVLTYKSSLYTEPISKIPKMFVLMWLSLYWWMGSVLISFSVHARKGAVEKNFCSEEHIKLKRK